MSYNPTQIQRSYDKLVSIWAYLNWRADCLDEGVKAAMCLLLDKRTDVIAFAWATRQEKKLSIETAHDRGRAKWSKYEI